MKYKCPECHAISDYLDYLYNTQQYITEYGSYSDGEYDYQDTEQGDNLDDGEYVYRCPECDYDTSNVEEFECDEEDQEDEGDNNVAKSIEIQRHLKKTII